MLKDHKHLGCRTHPENRNFPGWQRTRMPTEVQEIHNLVPGKKRVSSIIRWPKDDRRWGEIRTASPLGNENQKQLERNAALERDGYVHHRNTVKVKGSSLSEGEVTVVSRTNLLPGKFVCRLWPGWRGFWFAYCQKWSGRRDSKTLLDF